ncbi:helix-turn-helix transcriptional regulator [Nocardiopsis sp. ATB16-24]|uniref:helix-turn-helix domain-containing protein n=1 Tax=Nocardiopsis sp. ATB16-24 TaxID=3019555 RepID=UPI002555842B|nr:helix-turn-helix transcriptional regulator [Nocardiopsis sp. ATB16-24]
MAQTNIRRHRFGKKLAELRKQAGFTQAQVSDELETLQGSFARYERGERVPKRVVLHQLFDLYGVGPDEREEVMTLFRLAEQPSWWHPYRDLLRPEYAALLDLEVDASEIRTYQVIVPGLFQTPDYARQILLYGPQEIDDEEVERRLELRMARRQILSRENSPRLLTLMDEGALRRVVGDEHVMREQIQHLLYTSAQAQISIQIVPFDAGAHPAAVGGLTLLDCDDRRVVYLDTTVGELFLDKSAEVTTAARVFESLLGFALSVKESRELMEKYVEGYT